MEGACWAVVVDEEAAVFVPVAAVPSLHHWGALGSPILHSQRGWPGVGQEEVAAGSMPVEQPVEEVARSSEDQIARVVPVSVLAGLLWEGVDASAVPKCHVDSF